MSESTSIRGWLRAPATRPRLWALYRVYGDPAASECLRSRYHGSSPQGVRDRGKKNARIKFSIWNKIKSPTANGSHSNGQDNRHTAARAELTDAVMLQRPHARTRHQGQGCSSGRPAGQDEETAEVSEKDAFNQHKESTKLAWLMRLGGARPGLDTVPGIAAGEWRWMA